MDYDRNKIINAISKANNEFTNPDDKLSDTDIEDIVSIIESKLLNLTYIAGVEEIQDDVIYGISSKGAYKVAKAYTEYRYKQNMKRHGNSLDETILSIINYDNELIKQENSNKNPQVAPVQRDYIAGEVSKDISQRLLLPKEVVDAHNEGIIHFHDMDYFIQRIYNCCLINMEDVLQNGTVISETMIETPKSFLTACNIATQVIAQVASSEFGGQSFSLAHLAPFVDVSRKKLRKQIEEDVAATGMDATDDQITEMVERRLAVEIKSGIQLIQYQILTLMTTNGFSGWNGRCKIA
jgi:ribonucleoside-triphosphate reductase